MERKSGFFRKTKHSNGELVVLFEEIQEMRINSTDKDWRNKKFHKKLTSLEKSARKRVLKLLKDKQLKTSDDFLRAADIFHHGSNFKSYMFAVALSAISVHLGEKWGKNHYAVAVDRLLLSLGLPQYFGSHYIMRTGTVQLEEYNPKTTDKERLEYTIEPLRLLKRRAKDMERGIMSHEFLSED